MTSIIYPVTEPDLNGNEKRYVNEALDDGWISSNGRFVARFEQEFAAYTSARFAISCCNGTVALHLILAALGIGHGDEVLVPSFTYIASANAVSYTGATPILVDSSLEDWNIDTSRLQEALTPSTRAVIAVHLYGRPCDMSRLVEFAATYDLFLIEDAAEALGALINGKPVGSFGIAASFSFYGNKIVTTGEGGMVTTSDEVLSTKIRLLKGQGMDPGRRYWFTVMGYNYRMTNLAAAIGCAQLERVVQLVEARRLVASWYIRYLQPYEASLGISWQPDELGLHQVYWLFSLRVPSHLRDDLMKFLLQHGIDTRPFFIPLHSLPVYSHERYHANRKLHGAEHLGESGLSLPTYSRLKEDDVNLIANTVIRFLAKS